MSSDSATIKPIETDITLETVLQFARTLPAPVFVGIDAALGVPARLADSIESSPTPKISTFLDWIIWLFVYGSPDEPVNTPDIWSPGQPFIAVPPGKGSKLAFSQAGIQMHRGVEQGLNANSPLIVSGIPGTVGSGSRELWRELSQCLQTNSPDFNIWPYDGSLEKLFHQESEAHSITLAEIYPKVCYGIALAATLPTKLRAISKTKEPIRKHVIDELIGMLDGQLEIESIEHCYRSEDDFDAMISVVAMHKLMQYPKLFFSEPDTHPMEGGVMGKQGLMLS